MNLPFFTGHCSLDSPLSISGSMSITFPSSTIALMLQWPGQTWQKVNTSRRSLRPGRAWLACMAPCWGCMKDSMTGSNAASSVNPSMVMTRLPSQSAASTMQDGTILLSRETAHAPHSPMPQPSFVLANLNSSLSTSRRVWVGSTAISRNSPFTFNLICCFTSKPPLTFAAYGTLIPAFLADEGIEGMHLFPA